MDLTRLALKRPVFMICVVALMMGLGLWALINLPVRLFPKAVIPLIAVTTSYPGASSVEVDTEVSRPLERQMMALSGLKSVKSESRENISVLTIEFHLEKNIKEALREVRERIFRVRAQLPEGAEDPVVRKFDQEEAPLMFLTLAKEIKLKGGPYFYQNKIKERLLKLEEVAKVEVMGIPKKRWEVALDGEKLNDWKMTAMGVASSLGELRVSRPSGKVNGGHQVRVLSPLEKEEDLLNTLLGFGHNERPLYLRDVAYQGRDGVQKKIKEEFTYAQQNGKEVLIFYIYGHPQKNIIILSKEVHRVVDELKDEFPEIKNSLQIARDGPQVVKANVDDVKESILIGIFLTVVIVYLFLGSWRSTVITGLAIPNSLLGALVAMSFMGMSINIMTLLAFSLSVGLLIDDAIVVRENIYTYLEGGMKASKASLKGAREVFLPVMATTLVILAVFGPMAFMKGIVGQFFLEFGLVVCFVMIISTFDAMAVAPMLSAYWVGSGRGKGRGRLRAKASKLENESERECKGGSEIEGDRVSSGVVSTAIETVVNKNSSFKTPENSKCSKRDKNSWTKKIEKKYEQWLARALQRPKQTIILAIAFFSLLMLPMVKLPMDFLPSQDNGELVVKIEMPAGTSFEATKKTALFIEKELLKHSQIETVLWRIGEFGETYDRVSFFIKMKKGDFKTAVVKKWAREMLKKHEGKLRHAHFLVKDYDLMNAGEGRPFFLSLMGPNFFDLKAASHELLAGLEQSLGETLVDYEVSLKPDFKEVLLKKNPSFEYGVDSGLWGSELRLRLEGEEVNRQSDPAIYVSLSKQNKTKENLSAALAPNINGQLVQVASFLDFDITDAQGSIFRQDQLRSLLISADVLPQGQGLGWAMEVAHKKINELASKYPGISFRFEGQAESFNELIYNILVAMVLGIFFIYLILASLYESFFIPLLIMSLLPLAICGAGPLLYFTGHSLDLFSMIGLVMLLGLASKNSILLVDVIMKNSGTTVGRSRDKTRPRAMDRLKKGESEIVSALETEKRTDTEKQRERDLEAKIKYEIIKATKARLRPILMTSFSLIAGMLPVAIGLNPASAQRTGLGVSVIGGMLSSTALSLFLIPVLCFIVLRHRREDGRQRSGELQED